MRFFRSSSLTESNLYPLSRNSLIVRGRVVMVIQLCATFLGAWSCGMHVWDRDKQPILHDPHCTIYRWNLLDSTASSKKTQEEPILTTLCWSEKADVDVPSIQEHPRQPRLP